MVERKYVITYFDAPVIFHQSIQHSEMGMPIKSAGFVKIWADPETNMVRASCFGESKSMGLAANPDKDNEIIQSFLNEG